MGSHPVTEESGRTAASHPSGWHSRLGHRQVGLCRCDRARGGSPYPASFHGTAPVPCQNLLIAADLAFRARKAGGCRKPCHPMRAGRIPGPGRRAGHGADCAYRSFPQAGALVRRAGSAAMPGAADDVVMIGVLTGDQSQVPFAGNQHPVQALEAGAGDSAFGDRVRTRRPHRGLDDPHAGRSEHGIERRGELGVPGPDRELEAVSLVFGFISRLRACWVTTAPVGWAVIPARALRLCPQEPPPGGVQAAVN